MGRRTGAANATNPRTGRLLYSVPPDTEFPFENLEFWVYARFYLVGSINGFRTFPLDVYWHDAPEGVRRIGGRSLGSVRFLDRHPVVSSAWPVRPLIFPGTGRYEFQLLVELNRPWGRESRSIRSEFVRIERQP